MQAFFLDRQGSDGDGSVSRTIFRGDGSIEAGRDFPSGERDYAGEVASKLPLSEQLAERIAVAVIQGQLAPGERIREQDLSAYFGVSRGPVREALRVLEGDGFVRIEPYRGATVTMVSEREVQAALEMQISLFAAAARLAAEHAGDDDITQMEELVAALEKLAQDESASPESFMRQSLKATWLLIRSAGSERLAQTIRGLRRMTRPDRWVLGTATKQKQRKAAEHWRRLVAAVKARNPDRADMLARDRVRNIHFSAPAKAAASRERRSGLAAAK